MEFKTLDDVKRARLFGNSDFSNIINKSLKVIKENQRVFGKDVDITDTPISPMCIEDDLSPILFDEEVMNEYEKLIKLSNDSETALEHSFVLLGKKCKIGDEEGYLVDKFINCDSDDLRNDKVHGGEKKINDAINYGVNNSYTFISLGHNHPMPSLNVAGRTVARYLDDKTRDEEFIREAGLNISLQDFIAYESLYLYFFYRQNIRTSQTIFMYNGEVAIVSKQNTELRRFPIVLNAKTGEALYVSSKEDYKKKELWNA